MAALTSGLTTCSRMGSCSPLSEQTQSRCSQSKVSSACCMPQQQWQLEDFSGLCHVNKLARRPSTRQACTQSRQATASRGNVRMGLMGEDPEWNDDDYIALGLAHCFSKDEGAKLQDEFVVEPIPAGALECMDNGGTTCYKIVVGSNLGIALKQDLSLLPSEFQGAKFCEDFDFRTKCASRTWKRQHAQDFLLTLVPLSATRSDFNFSLEDKRVLNMEYEVNDADNIKQDMSIDVYGRVEGEEEGADKEIQKLYNA